MSRAEGGLQFQARSRGLGRVPVPTLKQKESGSYVAAVDLRDRLPARAPASAAPPIKPPTVALAIDLDHALGEVIDVDRDHDQLEHDVRFDAGDRDAPDPEVPARPTKKYVGARAGAPDQAGLFCLCIYLH